MTFVQVDESHPNPALRGQQELYIRVQLPDWTGLAPYTGEAMSMACTLHGCVRARVTTGAAGGVCNVQTSRAYLLQWAVGGRGTQQGTDCFEGLEGQWAGLGL